MIANGVVDKWDERLLQIERLFDTLKGVGTIAGGMISGSTAAVLTASMAEAYIKLMVKLVQDGDKKKLEQKAFVNLCTGGL